MFRSFLQLTILLIKINVKMYETFLQLHKNFSNYKIAFCLNILLQNLTQKIILNLKIYELEVLI